MARISKNSEAPRDLAGCFRVGIYARLSVDKSGVKDAHIPAQGNESIETQIAIARQYMAGHPEMELFQCYTDLGRTGTNFQRAGFEQMMDDIKQGYINCIIVKDLSRFGRNHIEVGNYIQKIFPFMHVRFIAVTDGIDTFRENPGVELLWNLKNLVNEMYALSIAQKVKASRNCSRALGSYTGGPPPYGYRLERVDGKRCLFPCPLTSGIVMEIYSLFLREQNMGAIIRTLYEREIHRPAAYQRTGHVYRCAGEKLEEWGRGTVKRILSNPVYIEQEGIISKKAFLRAGQILEEGKKQNQNRGEEDKTPGEDIYSGVLFCGDCGKKMVRTVNYKKNSLGVRVPYYSYVCPNSKRGDNFQCPSKGISIMTLNRLVKTALRQTLFLSSDCISKKTEQVLGKIEEQIRHDLARCERQIEGMKRRRSEQYMQYRLELPSGEYKQPKSNTSLCAHMEKKAELMMLADNLSRKTANIKKFVNQTFDAELTGDIIRSFVHQIWIYGGRRVKVMLRVRSSLFQFL